MGTDLTKSAQDTAHTSPVLPALGRPGVPTIPWLDPATAAGVVDIVQSLASGHPEALAVILFGSVARREERPLDDPQPSDVDLLLLLDPAARELTREQELRVIRTIAV